MNKEIIKQKTVGELLMMNEEIMRILMESGMHCLGCPSSHSETLTEACDIHGLDLDGILNQIAEVLN